MTTEETLRKIDATLRKNPVQETLLYLRDTGLYQGIENTRVLAVGGASIVKDKIFSQLQLYMADEDRDRLKGKVFCLIDTDCSAFDPKQYKDGTNIQIRRLLIKKGDSPVSLEKLNGQDLTSTVIEDV